MLPDREQSEFNMAFAWLSRLNYWFWSANESKYNNDGYGWCKSLLVLFDELTTEMKEKEQKEKLEEIKGLYGKINSLVKQKKDGIPQNIYWELSEMERWLRSIANKSGLLKKIKEDPSRALG